ncbi:uncharacterized protein [Aristolochia californica]|uniref:uncharacterized protein n=1 Tax=Aristolochia californica TaxID=171875 RepID=UPI0035D8E6B9
MALIAYQPRAACATSSPKPVQWNKLLKSRGCVSFRNYTRTEGCISLRRHVSLSGQGQLNLSLKAKPIKILAFKGGVQKEGSEGRSNSSKFPKNSSQFSYAAQEKEETTSSEDVARVPLSYASKESGETVTASVAIQNLFKKWLLRLQTQTPSQTENGMFEGQPENEISPSQPASLQRGASNLIKAAVAHFFGLDAAVKFPLLIFIPWYLTINVAYGAEVSRELTPLWVFGPLIVALYIKLVQGLCALYVFTFKQFINLVKSLPIFCFLIHKYISEGKLKEFILAHVWQPVEKIKNLDYKELSMKKLEQLKEWAVEKYLDFVESIWPYYCRTIRFLKKANLI